MRKAGAKARSLLYTVLLVRRLCSVSSSSTGLILHLRVVQSGKRIVDISRNNGRVLHTSDLLILVIAYRTVLLRSNPALLAVQFRDELAIAAVV